MHIVAINGFKRSGKGATANAIEGNILIGTVKQVGFADKVKIFAARSMGLLDRTEQQCIDLMNDAKERWMIDALREPIPGGFITVPIQVAHLTGRQFLQNVGTEARKLFGDDFWVDQVLPLPTNQAWPDQQDRRALKRMHPGVDWLLITDLRFENEAQRVLDLGGEVWRVTRPGTESDGHDSEQMLPDKYVTREIDNNGSLEQLDEIVSSTLKMMEDGIR